MWHVMIMTCSAIVKYMWHMWFSSLADGISNSIIWLHGPFITNFARIYFFVWFLNDISSIELGYSYILNRISFVIKWTWNDLLEGNRKKGERKKRWIIGMMKINITAWFTSAKILTPKCNLMNARILKICLSEQYVCTQLNKNSPCTRNIVYVCRIQQVKVFDFIGLNFYCTALDKQGISYLNY